MKCSKHFALLAITMLGSGGAWAGPGGKTPAHDPEGTWIKATASVYSSWRRAIYYDWSLEKTAAPANVEIHHHKSAEIRYTIAAKREVSKTDDQFKVSGEICASNSGPHATSDLRIRYQLQRFQGGDWNTIEDGAREVWVNEELGAGQSQCYPYKLSPNLMTGHAYRILVWVTIDNYVGYDGDNRGDEVIKPLVLVREGKTIEHDREAVLSEAQSCPEGFTCSAPNLVARLSDSTTVQYTVRVTNNSCRHGIAYLDNTATLKAKDSHTESKSSARVTINSDGRRGD